MSKDIEYYMNLPYTIEITKRNDGDGIYYFARIEELSGCHTDAPTIAEAITELEEIQRDYLEIKLESGGEIIEPNEDLPSGQIPLRMPKTMHKQLLNAAKKEGVSANQFAVVHLAQALGLPSNLRGEKLKL